MTRFLLWRASMGDESSLFRRALFRRITSSDEVRPQPPAAAAPRSPAPPPSPPGVPRRRCVLVVEDNEVMREGMAAMLDDAGWLVVEADSLDRARAMLGVVRPSVMLLDYDLRGEYASVLLDELVHARRATPTVLVSACPLALDAARDYRIELVLKPFPIEQLVRTLDDVVTRRHASVPMRVAP